MSTKRDRISPAGGGGDAASKNWIGFAHLVVVYIIWGSTYLAIRVAVREGSGFPPFTMSAMRVLAAGAIILAGTRLTGQRLRLRGHELRVLLASSQLLWIGGNGLVVWAEMRAHSGYAALLVGSMPIWVAVIESLIDRRAPSRLLVASLTVGFVGVGVLSGPVLLSGVRADMMSTIALLVAPISWACGAILQRRRPVNVSPLVSSGYQLLFGGAGFIALALIVGEPRPAPIREAWIAWGYLVVFGSLLGFTSFVRVLHLLPTGVVATYAYVNPVVAVLLGWVLLDEPITTWTAVGSALVLGGVAGVFHERRARARRARRETERVAALER